MLTAKPRVQGYTLIELVTTIAVLAILVGLATPMVKNAIRNGQIRTTAETLQNALRTTQSEAVRQNTLVAFVISAATPQLNGTPALVGNYWYIQSAPTQAGQAISSANLVQMSTTAYAGTGLSIATTQAVVCFNAIGQQASYTNSTTLPMLPGDCQAQSVTYTVTGAAGTHPLNVTLGLGGKVRMCDPSKVFSATNPDGCAYP